MDQAVARFELVEELPTIDLNASGCARASAIDRFDEVAMPCSVLPMRGPNEWTYV
jgi:hypothetical protein